MHRGQALAETRRREPAAEPREAHLLLRFSRPAVKKMYDDLQLYWSEKSRLRMR